MSGETDKSDDNDDAPTGNTHPVMSFAGLMERWFSLSERTRRGALMAVGMGLLLLVVLILVLTLTNRGRCSLSSRAPSLSEPRAVHTVPDARNMAKMKGYIHIYQRGYLALDIKRMTVDRHQGRIKLADDCVDIAIYYANSPDSTYVSFVDIQWILTGAREAAPDCLGRCSLLVPQFAHNFPTTRRYSCLDRRAHECRKGGEDARPLGMLVVESLEVELEGDSELIYRGEFSKPPYVKSCGH